MEQRKFTVTQLNQFISGVINHSSLIDIVVIGEVTNLSSSRGNHYFSLKDENAKIDAVIFKNTYDQLQQQIENGKQIIVTAKVNFYEPWGKISLIVSNLQLYGEGLLELKFRQLKEKLLKEGLFEESHKKKISSLVFSVALLAANEGAARYDVIKSLNQKNNLIKVDFFPCLVQGVKVATDIIRVLDKIKDKQYDFVVISRGGGSLEDLMAFNEEDLIRYVFKYKLPIVSAIGHEVDFTLLDYVADVRSKTPTAVADLVISKADLYRNLNEYNERMNNAIRHKINEYKFEFESKKTILNQKLWKYYSDRTLFLDNLNNKLSTKINLIITQNKLKLNEFKNYFEKLNPENLFEKGYAIIENNKNKQIRTIDDIRQNDQIKIFLKSGRAKAVVKEVKKNDNK